MDYKLTKEERIYKRDELQKLFQNPASFVVFPFKVLHYENNRENILEPAVKVAISVPKKNFKKAVSRNLLKRRVREAYRTNKHSLLTEVRAADKQVLFMLIYIAKEELDYHKIEEKIILTLRRLQYIYAENSK